MTADEIREQIRQARLSVLELSAMTGLPGDYLEKILNGKFPATEGDWLRLKNAVMKQRAKKG